MQCVNFRNPFVQLSALLRWNCILLTLLEYCLLLGKSHCSFLPSTAPRFSLQLIPLPERSKQEASSCGSDYPQHWGFLSVFCTSDFILFAQPLSFLWSVRPLFWSFPLAFKTSNFFLPQLIFYPIVFPWPFPCWSHWGFNPQPYADSWLVHSSWVSADLLCKPDSQLLHGGCSFSLNFLPIFMLNHHPKFLCWHIIYIHTRTQTHTQAFCFQLLNICTLWLYVISYQFCDILALSNYFLSLSASYTALMWSTALKLGCLDS